MHDEQFKVHCLRRIDYLIQTVGISAYPVRYIEGATLSSFLLKYHGSVAEIKKHEHEFKNNFGDKTTLTFKNGICYITVPKPVPEILPLSTILQSPFYHQCPGTLKIAIGEDIEGRKVVGDLERWIHVLVAGETGSGKSVFLHNVVISLMQNCDISLLRFVIIDTKRTEFVIYEGLSYLQLPIAYEPKTAEKTLMWLVAEMNRRFKLFQEQRCRDIKSYNNQNNPLPYIVVIIDEFANLTQASKNAEKQLIQLASLSRAAGIHLILSTQRPSTDVVVPLIKANVPTRIAFNVTDAVNSRVILDENGAENLIKRGDMLLKDEDGIMRIQGAYISEREIEQIIAPYIVVNQFEEDQLTLTEYNEEYSDEIYKAVDDEFEEAYQTALECILEKNRCSKWFIKRNVGCGDTLAERILERLESEGVIGDWNRQARSFEILISPEDLEG